MKKILIIILCVSFILTGCASESIDELNVTESGTSINSETEEFIIKLLFGNGEIYRGTASCIYYPKSDVSLSKYTYSITTPNHFNSLWITEDMYWQNSGVELSNGYFYSFSECYRTVYDEETKTIFLYLWRDEPYILEKTFFEKVDE